MQRLTLTILGLEKDIWETIESKEKSKFNSVTFFFILSMFSALIGIYFSMYIVIGNVLQTIVSSLFLIFIYFNIFRFSIVTIRRSFFAKIKPIENKLDEISHVIVPENKITKFKIKPLKPSFGNIVRSFVYVVLIQIVVFGLVVCFNWKSIKNESQTIRANMISEYAKTVSNNQLNLTNKLKLDLAMIDQKIIDLKTMNDSNSVYFVKLIEKRKSIQNEILETTVASDKLVNYNIEHFKNKIENKFFPIQIVLNPQYHSSFLLFELILIFLFFIPVRIMFKLKHDETFNYAKLSNEKFRHTVRIEYEKLELYFNETIGKYDSNAKLNAIWEDAPFNTEYKKKSIKRTPVSILQLVK